MKKNNIFDILAWYYMKKNFDPIKYKNDYRQIWFSLGAAKIQQRYCVFHQLGLAQFSLSLFSSLYFISFRIPT